MAELNLKQITDKLNSEFASDVRKLVFWYDANAEFQEDIDSIELKNAKVLHLEPDNQFYIKYFLEREDTTTNYLVYAPFAKPSIRDDHLADTIRYSKEFFADRASLLTLDLGIDERYKPVIQHYIKFFANKDRTQKFYDLEIENFNRSTIEVALMSVLCKDKTASFEEVLRSILTDDGLQDNKYLAEFEKYDLLSAFWQQADVAFGYNDPKPTLEKLVITMFVTYAAKSIHTDMPQAWKPFISYKFGNIIAFMDNLMNSYLYGTRFDEISEIIYNAINGKNYLEKMEVETLVDCNIFAGVDELLISWIIGRLENEDIGAKLNGKTIPELCVERRKQHFGKNFRSEYFILQNAFDMIAEGKYQPVSGIKNLVKEYMESTYKIDRYYRYFYFYFDKLEDTTQFEKIRELVENIYTNEYLNRITVNWNNELADADGETGLTLQRDFFARHINHSKDRVVVIISDAVIRLSTFSIPCEQEKQKQEDLGLHCEVTIDGYTDFIFINRFGQAQHQATLNKAIRRIIRDCNDEQFLHSDEPDVLLPHFSCHSLRHTFTTRMCEAGVNIKVIQDALGHSDISTTLNIYADVTKEMKAAEFKGLDSYFKG